MRPSFLLLFLGVTGVSTAYRILFLNPIGSKSNLHFYWPILRSLANRGHQITMATAYEVDEQHENITRIGLQGMDISTFIPNVFEGQGTFIFFYVGKVGPMLCNNALQQKPVQELANQKFDLVLLSVFYSDCFLSLPYKMKVPFVWLVPAVLFSPFGDTFGNPTFPSFAPDPFYAIRSTMTFGERFTSTLTSTVLTLYLNKLVVHWTDTECRRRNLCPKDMPHLSQLRQQGSLSVINSIQTLERPNRPYMANVIHAGGIHCRFPGPLPKDLEEWISGYGNRGFIYFSMGSAIKTEEMPKKYLQVILSVFGSLPHRVLMKWHMENISHTPPNILIRKWLPQQDILGDPRLKVFISHGGILSTMEATFHGVPVLGMPVFGDQVGNMNEVENQGWGKMIKWSELTEEKFHSLIVEIISSNKMRATVQKLSRVMKDQHHSPADLATFWIEYVIRHNGAYHLRSPAASMT